MKSTSPKGYGIGTYEGFSTPTVYVAFCNQCPLFKSGRELTESDAVKAWEAHNRTMHVIPRQREVPKHVLKWLKQFFGCGHPISAQGMDSNGQVVCTVCQYRLHLK